MSSKKSLAYNMNQIITALSSIKDRQLRVYGAITLYLATRSGEIMPYRHYHYKYELNTEGKVMKAISNDGESTYASKRVVLSTQDSPGIDVATISVYKNRIEFVVPVFKCKKKVEEKAYIYSKGNPFFVEIQNYILERQARRKVIGKPVYLFEATDCDVEKYFHNFKKRFIRALQKQLPGAKVHSLRKTMATYAAIISGGNIFFVKGVTRHRKLETLNEYVAPIQLQKQFEEYLGVEDNL